MTRRHAAFAFGSVFLLLVATFVVLAGISNWNSLRDPIGRYVEHKTGRQLVIRGDLKIDFGWPTSRVSIGETMFSNPAWATGEHMLAVRAATFDIAMVPLLRRALVLKSARLEHARVALEKSPDGRKNWLLDPLQRDGRARLDIERLAIDDGEIVYREPAAKTHLTARLSTSERTPDASPHPLHFKVQGRYKGVRMTVGGTGASVLALRDTETPYDFYLKGRVGDTDLSASGQLTDLLKPSAVNLDVTLRGTSLAGLYPILGIVLPDTPPYSTAGRLIKQGATWRYDKFSGKIGGSDIAGDLKVTRDASNRPKLVATLQSQRLDLADLGPVVGATSSGDEEVPRPPGHVLPAQPFRTARWNRMDADVKLTARSIQRARSLPLSNLSTHLKLNNAVLTLDPLRFGVAGGTLAGVVTLDGREPPIRASTTLNARKLKIANLFPTLDLNRASIGEVNGRIKLKGRGDTVAQMLGTSDGELAMLVDGGEISKFMMEAVSLHLLEMLQLKITGDEPVKIRCGVAAFAVRDGVMQAKTLVLDTDIARIEGRGTVHLGTEALDLTIVPKTKRLSLLSLRTPITVAGRFSDPEITLDKGKLAMRGLGALALGAINPVLSLLPLIDAGAAEDSECARLFAEAGKASPPGDGRRR